MVDSMSPLQPGQPAGPNVAPLPAAAPTPRTGPAAPPVQQRAPGVSPQPGSSANQGTVARSQSNGIDRVEISQQAVNATPNSAPGAPDAPIYDLDNVGNPATAPVSPNAGGAPDAAPNASATPGMPYPPAGGPPPPPQEYQSPGQFLDLTA